MAVVIIDGVPCHQDFNVFDPSCPIIRDDGRGVVILGHGAFRWPGAEGILPDGVTAYKNEGDGGSPALTVNDPIAGYAGPVRLLATTTHAFAYVVRAT